MTLSELLSASSAATGPALVASGQPDMSYPALARQVEAIAAALRDFGVARSDRVAVVLPNGPVMATAFLGTASAATCAPLNPAYRTSEFEFFLADLRPKLLIVADGDDSPAIAVANAMQIPIARAIEDLAAPAGTFKLVGTTGYSPVAPSIAHPSDVALLLHTSGTTARPKLVPLTHENLCASAVNIRNTLRLTPADRCVNVMPLFHIHGLVAALLSSLSAGACVACSPGFVATRIFDWLNEFQPTWYTAVPTMHQAILARAESENLKTTAPLRFIRSSSASLPPIVAEGLERVFGVSVIEAYGMTEAAHQMCCNPLPPGERKLGSVGLPAGPEVAVMDAAGTLQPKGQSGEVVIRGANVTPGYDANPQANAAAFTDGWFRTGDIGHFDADGYLFLSGRIKEIINRGGEKISPREIDETLLRHPAVAAATAFGMPDPRLGEEVAAAVVLRPGQMATERDLITFAAATLAHFKVPRRLLILDDIPKGPTGKVQRVGLAKTLGLDQPQPAVAASASAAAPSTPTEISLAKIWCEVLERPSVGVNDSFFDLGGDSILAVQVIGRVRTQMNAELSMPAFFEHPTVAAMAKSLDETDALLASIQGMTDEEAAALLAAESKQ